MALKNVIFQQNAATGQDADEVRLMIQRIMGDIAGVGGSTHLVVSQRAAGVNMSVDISAGGVFVNGDENALQGMYFSYNDAATNLAVSAAHATLPRKDLVIARVRDTFYSGANNDIIFEVVAGTAAGSPTEPNLTALGYKNYIVLALIDVAAAATTITNGNITDRRARAGAAGGIYIVTSTTRPASPFEGMTIYETDTDKIRTYSGSAWLTISATGTLDTWVPVVNNNGSAAVTASVGYAWYRQFGKFVDFAFRLNITGASAGAGVNLVTLPVPAARTGDLLGFGAFSDASANIPHAGGFYTLTTTQGYIIRDQSAGNTGVAIQMAASDIYWATGRYEAATAA